MKLPKFWMMIAAVFALMWNAAAQLGPTTPDPQKLFNTTSVIYLPGLTTTNLPTTFANKVFVGQNGIGFALQMSATNAASTTNATFVVELLANNTDVVDNQTYSLSVPQNGTSAYDYWTNLPSSTPNLLNGKALRIRSIQNTNVLGIFITNAVALSR